MTTDKPKDAWPIIEAAAREQENVGDEFSLRWAKIDFEDQPGSVEYVEYRLRKMDGPDEGKELYGRIENYATIRP